MRVNQHLAALFANVFPLIIEERVLVVAEIAFWLVVSLMTYTFLGYPLLAALLSRVRTQPVRKQSITPSVTILICAHNEEALIKEKLENCLNQDYPSGQLEIVVVSDGSDDNTVPIVSRYSGRGVKLYHQSERQGKASAVNRAVPLSRGDIVVFTDANAILNQDAVRNIVRGFADASVGGVAGEKRVTGAGEGLYWRYESWIKRSESSLGSVMGAAGRLFAMRRSLFSPLSPDTLLDDFTLSMRLVSMGWRVIYEPAAWAGEEASTTLTEHWQRRVRFAAGGWQAISRLPKMLGPGQRLLAWKYYSHRVLRWMVTPSLLPLSLLLNLFLLGQPLYRVTLVLQAVLYGLALLGYALYRLGTQAGLPYIVLHFFMSNIAALVGAWRYLRGTQLVTYPRVHQSIPVRHRHDAQDRSRS